jgi:hypothetical protein
VFCGHRLVVSATAQANRWMASTIFYGLASAQPEKLGHNSAFLMKA